MALPIPWAAPVTMLRVLSCERPSYCFNLFHRLHVITRNVGDYLAHEVGEHFAWPYLEEYLDALGRHVPHTGFPVHRREHLAEQEVLLAPAVIVRRPFHV